uniref:Uncharacterized protein n=1 Tax=Arundo donax TaxID=35708 RepID=A0A0A8Z0H9_ARUDO
MTWRSPSSSLVGVPQLRIVARCRVPSRRPAPRRVVLRTHGPGRFRSFVSNVFGAGSSGQRSRGRHVLAVETPQMRGCCGLVGASVSAGEGHDQEMECS